MVFEKTYRLDKKNEITIKLPEKFKSRKKVKVIVEDVDEKKEKLELLKDAVNDPLFLEDVEEIKKDFQDSICN